MISKFDKFSFINENQTTFQGDRSAIQLEYKFTPNDIQIHTYTVFTNNYDSFYQFSYYAEPESFSKYLSDFKKIINIIKFTTQNK
jgi:hypothetical protein